MQSITKEIVNFNANDIIFTLVIFGGIIFVILSFFIGGHILEYGVYETFLEPIELFIRFIIRLFSKFFDFLIFLFNGLLEFFKTLVSIIYSRLYTAEFCKNFIIGVVLKKELFILRSYAIFNTVIKRGLGNGFIVEQDGIEHFVGIPHNAIRSPYSINIDSFGDSTETFIKSISKHLIAFSFIQFNNALGKDFKYIRVCVNSMRKELLEKIMLLVGAILNSGEDVGNKTPQ